ncbi:MAG: DUF2815 family protein, partial [Bacillota bacterium]|nr:DUF2815 family protein [Bacillota bacterium]
ASSKQAPEIVDLNLQRILSQTEIYSGIYARVSVRFFAYASNEKKGIGCGLGPVQKIQDGEPLGGMVSEAAAFGENSGGYSPYCGQANVSTQKSTTYPQQPVYNPRIPVDNSQLPVYYPQQSVYQQAAYPGPQQPLYHQQTPVIDPITGAPVNGGVMGL